MQHSDNGSERQLLKIRTTEGNLFLLLARSACHTQNVNSTILRLVSNANSVSNSLQSPRKNVVINLCLPVDMPEMSFVSLSWLCDSIQKSNR